MNLWIKLKFDCCVVNQKKICMYLWLTCRLIHLSVSFMFNVYKILFKWSRFEDLFRLNSFFFYFFLSFSSFKYSIIRITRPSEKKKPTHTTLIFVIRMRYHDKWQLNRITLYIEKIIFLNVFIFVWREIVDDFPRKG